jgi:hypothetical protein
VLAMAWDFAVGELASITLRGDRVRLLRGPI